MQDKKLTRAQQRHLDRVNEEATRIHSSLSEQFLNAFTLSDDPEGEVIKELYKTINAKWRGYCRLKQFNTDSFGAIEISMDRVIQIYRTEKNPELIEK